MSAMTKNAEGHLVADNRWGPAETVREEWGLECPTCKSDEHLEVAVSCFMALTPDGTSEDGAVNGDHEWDDSSVIQCQHCGWHGVVRDAKVPQ